MDNNTQTQMDVDMSEFTVSVSVSRQRVEDLFTLGWRGSYYWCRFMASTDLPAGCVSSTAVKTRPLATFLCSSLSLVS
mgnify:CR=1 FL=1